MTQTIIDALPGKNKLLVIRAPFSPQNVAACKNLPDFRSYLPQQRAWVCRPSLANIEHIHAAFGGARWTEAALAASTDVLSTQLRAAELVAEKARLSTLVDLEPPTDYPFKTTPFAHQTRAFVLSRDERAFGLFMEQGTGKTKVTVDSLSWQHMHHGVTGALVVCPNGVKSTWEEEIATHMPTIVKRVVMVHEAGAGVVHQRQMEMFINSPGAGGVDVLIMNVEAFATDRGRALAERFLKTRVCTMVVDESTMIKTPSAKRTKAIIKLGKLARFRRILTGTPVTQSPLDVYAQVKFLDDNILGFSSMYAFRNRYAIMGGWNAREVIGFAHLDELKEKLAPYSFRVLKEECLDLPPKTYQVEEIDLTPEQRAAYTQMKDEMLVDLGDGRQASVTIVLTQMMRLQQIVGGFLPADGSSRVTPIGDRNPKLEALLEICERVPGKLVIWSRFVPEIELIVARLREVHGVDAVTAFYGAVDNDERARGRRAFQDPGSPVRFFVGNPSAGGKGLTLTAAHTCVYFSNDFSLENRLQTEDRLHRIGQQGHENRVTYIDLRARKTIDKYIIKTLRDKKNLADLVTGDIAMEWLS